MLICIFIMLNCNMILWARHEIHESAACSLSCAFLNHYSIAHLAMSFMISSVNTLGTPAAPIRTVGLGKYVFIHFIFKIAWFIFQMWSVYERMFFLAKQITHHKHDHQPNITIIIKIILQFLDNVFQLIDLSMLMCKWCLVLRDSSLKKEFINGNTEKRIFIHGNPEISRTKFLANTVGQV